jgi:hypothetical protein
MVKHIESASITTNLTFYNLNNIRAVVFHYFI